MPEFSDFDSRGYRTVDVPTGYREWVTTYEKTVEDTMDIALLDRLEDVPWPSLGNAADLGCGTGRTGAWLREKGVGVIDGVDITPEMLSMARSKQVYRMLLESDLGSSGLESGAYDLAVSCLVDEHLPDLQPLYSEAGRLVRAGGFFVLAGYHPHFVMAFGVPTHFESESGEAIAIDTHIHLMSDHVTAGLDSGWRLIEMQEGVIDEGWLAIKPEWQRYRNHPVSFALAWNKPATGSFLLAGQPEAAPGDYRALNL